MLAEMATAQPLWTSVVVSLGTKQTLLCDPAVTFSGIHAHSQTVYSTVLGRYFVNLAQSVIISEVKPQLRK